MTITRWYRFALDRWTFGETVLSIIRKQLKFAILASLVNYFLSLSSYIDLHYLTLDS